jgi:hypothetical protein
MLLIIIYFLIIEYSYNPCKPFSEGTGCINVAACQVSNDGLYSFSIGKQENAVWSSDSGLGTIPSVTYSYNEKRVKVSLQCGTYADNRLEAIGEGPTNYYQFRLTHKCACWNGCQSKTFK